jgi:MOSC domain-containing protein YiiM
MVATVLSVNVGLPRPHGESRGHTVMSAIGKEPVDGRVRVEGEQVEGDRQTDRRYHGGPDQAVYAYAREDADWWASELGREITPGLFGENLTTAGVDPNRAVIGERWQIAEVLLEVTAPRIPCAKLGRVFPGTGIVRRFAAAGRPGAYLRILEPGTIGAGDTIDVVSVPDHGLTVAGAAEIMLREPERRADLLVAPQLAGRLRRWAEG